MMTMELLFGIQINSEMVMPITLSGINLKTKVEELKREAAGRWNLSKDSLGKVILHYLKTGLCQSICNFCYPCLTLIINFFDLLYLR